MAPTANTALNDTTVVLQGVEQLALIVGVIAIVTILLRKKDLIPAAYKNPLLLLAGLWVVAVSVQYSISVYSYIDTFRPMYKSMEQQRTELQ